MNDQADRVLRERLQRLESAVPLRSTRRLTPTTRSTQRAPWAGAGVLTVCVVALVIVLASGFAGGARSPQGVGSMATGENGPYRLTVRTDAQRYEPNAPIEVTAIFEYLGPNAQTQVGGSLSFLGFGVQEVDGPRHVGPAYRSVLTTYTFQRGVAVTYPFAKSGGTTGDSVNDAFFQTYMNSQGGRPDPVLRLPAGRWRIFAEASGVALRVGVTVDVGDVQAAGPAPTAPAVDTSPAAVATQSVPPSAPAETEPPLPPLDPPTPPEQVPGECIARDLVFDRFEIPPELLASSSETVVIGTVEAVGKAQWNTPDGEAPSRKEAAADKVFRLIRVHWTQEFGSALPNPTVVWIQGGEIGCDRLTHGDYPQDLAVGAEYAFFLRDVPPASGMPDVLSVIQMWPIVGGTVTTLFGKTMTAEELAQRIELAFEGSAADVCDAMADGSLPFADSPAPIAVAGAFDVTAADVAAWQEAVARRDGLVLTSAYRNRPPGTREVVCFMDGTFDDPRAGPDQQPRMVRVHEPGSGHPPSTVLSGPRERIPVEDPSQFAAAAPSQPVATRPPADVAMPYPDGCAAYELSERRCAYIVEWVRGQAGLTADAPVTVELLGDPDCEAGAECRLSMQFVVRVRMTTPGGVPSEYSVLCGLGGQYSLLCNEHPQIRISTPTTSGYGDVPCETENGPCATPLPTIEPDAMLASQPLGVGALDIEVDHVGDYTIDVGDATLPNGILSTASFELADEAPKDVLMEPHGIQMQITSLEDGRRLESLYDHGWRPGTERVRVRLRFSVQSFEPGAAIQVLNLEVR
jgi:hypothetical protein